MKVSGWATPSIPGKDETRLNIETANFGVNRKQLPLPTPCPSNPAMWVSGRAFCKADSFFFFFFFFLSQKKIIIGVSAGQTWQRIYATRTHLMRTKREN